MRHKPTTYREPRRPLVSLLDMRNRNACRATILVLIPLLLIGCSTTTTETTSSESPVNSGPAASTPANITPSTLNPSTTPTPAPVVPAEQIFTTPDGSLSFTYPASWTVTPVADQPNNYLVADGNGAKRATLRDRVEGLPFLSVPTGIDTGYKTVAPGIKGPSGQGVSLLVQGTFGQAVGSQGAIYSLATDGSDEPIGRSAIEVPTGGYYVMFTGYTALNMPTVPPSKEELVVSATTFADSALFAETAKVMASLKLHPEKVQVVGCLGAKYKYLKLTGISCNDAKATLDRVEKTGTGVGARSTETTDYICFYASAGETQSGQADVVCRNKANPDGTSFEAWFK